LSAAFLIQIKLPNIVQPNLYCLNQFYKIVTVFCCLLLFAGFVKAQIVVSGTIYDSTKSVPVAGVEVYASNGNTAISDSSGHYTITARDKDSLTFWYHSKPTAKFAIRQIENTTSFDISLHIRVSEKFKMLKEVKIYGKNYRQDSMENREQYAKLFSYQRPGISPVTDYNTGAAGMDLNELINVFRFRRNKQMRRMQERLLSQEQDNYINYRFNKTTVKRITRLEGANLDAFMKDYRPTFEFTQNSTLPQFYQYILDASYDFRQQQLINDGKPAETFKMVPQKKNK